MLHASTYFNLLPYVKALVQREQYRHQSNGNKICSNVFRVKFELVFTKQGKLKFSQKKKVSLKETFSGSNLRQTKWGFDKYSDLM